ncbi:MAG TPA: hypothetical protein VFQ68_19090 [Streptosporangiaceae bacterium]|nr:hypothetical protein [Streptosporangiaceae bacterium]
MMTLEEARSHIGHGVAHNSRTRGSAEYVIAATAFFYVYIRSRSDNHGELVRPQDLTLLSEAEPVAPRDLMALSQARLNELAAAIIRTAPGDRRQIERAVEALALHTLASGFTFEDVPGDGTTDYSPEVLAELASLMRPLEAAKRADASSARQESEKLESGIKPHAAEILENRPGFRADQPALVYLVTHAAYGAAKIGVADTAGSRLAQHRRQGWEIVAAFQVKTASAAIAIETEVLRYWRGPLGLPPCLKAGQMPQGGYTETVALSGIDPAATATRICNLAVQQDARPGLSQDGRLAC